MSDHTKQRVSYGYVNGMSRERSAEVSAQRTQCVKNGHDTGSTSTQRGQHHYWCDTCGYEYRIDSGG